MVDKEKDGRPLMERLGRTTVAVGVVLVLGWGILFAAGLIINSGPYRDELGSTQHLPFWRHLKDWFMAFTSYTMTNVLLLSCLASLIGDFGQRLKLDRDGGSDQTASPWAAAITRGFFIYLVGISGILLLVENPFSATSPQQYVRLAGFMSLLSFMMGYSPDMFGKFFKRVAEALEGQIEEKEEEKSIRRAVISSEHAPLSLIYSFLCFQSVSANRNSKPLTLCNVAFATLR